MASVFNSDLFPPVMDTAMPGFDKTKPCKIYFDLGGYNQRDKINHVQLIVNYQRNKKSALNKKIYKNNIKFADLKQGRTVNEYYIELSPSDMEDSKFLINTVYLAQLRFSSIEKPESGGEAGWLAANESKFSEWSTVCILRPISTPSLTFNAFDTETANSNVYITTPTLELLGKLIFADKEETDILYSYRIKLYDEQGTLLDDSEDRYVSSYSNVNEINYTIKANFEQGKQYSVQVNAVTQSNFTIVKKYTVYGAENVLSGIKGYIKAFPIEESGMVEVQVQQNPFPQTTSSSSVMGCETKTVEETPETETDAAFFGTVTIIRSSSKNNFKYWEDVYTTQVNAAEGVNLRWLDRTVESGVWYKYAIQPRNQEGVRGLALITKEPVIVNYEDIYLLDKERALKIKFNPSISSFKRNLFEQKIDTLGSKYPFIVRNGVVEYHSFPIQGTISFLMDDINGFFTPEELYQDANALYQEYQTQHNISKYNDIITEKMFRDKVIDFLYNNEVKMFKSATEGNYLVKLMNISFTPNQTLGRYIYDFSCEAYEVAECNNDNLDYYGIQPHSLSMINSIIDEYTKYGQLSDNYINGQNLLSTIAAKYSDLAQSETHRVRTQNLSYLRIQFTSEPYVVTVGTVDGQTVILPKKINMTGVTYLRGYVIRINNASIFVGENGYYELSGSNVDVTDFSIYNDTSADIDYVANLVVEEDPDLIIKRLFYYKKLCQLAGYFESGDSLYRKIEEAHFYNSAAFYTKLNTINGFRIECEPNAVFTVKYRDINNIVTEDTFTIGSTGILTLWDDNVGVIENIIFNGIQLKELTTVGEESVPDGYYYDSGISILVDVDTNTLKENYVYQLSGYALEIVEDFGNSVVGVTNNEVDTDTPTGNYALRLVPETGSYATVIKKGDSLYPIDITSGVIGSELGIILDYECETVKGVR